MEDYFGLLTGSLGTEELSLIAIAVTVSKVSGSACHMWLGSTSAVREKAVIR